MNVITIPIKKYEILNKIINELKTYDINSSGEFITKNIQELKYNNQEEFNTKILDIFNTIQRPLFLMNDHPITLSIINNLKKIKENLGIIIFDAHPDCDVNYKFDFFGEQKDLLLSLIDDKIIEPKNIVLVGLRKWTKDEFYFLKNTKIRYFDIKKIDEMGINELGDTLMENARIFENFYLSFDMDVLDPSYAPGVNSPEPNGLTSREVLFLINRLKRLKNLVGMDLSEVNLENDVNSKTVKLAAKIISEIG